MRLDDDYIRIFNACYQAYGSHDHVINREHDDIDWLHDRDCC